MTQSWGVSSLNWGGIYPRGKYLTVKISLLQQCCEYRMLIMSRCRRVQLANDDFLNAF